MELIKVISCCCLLSILLTDVVLASPVRSRAIAEAERLEYAIEEGKLRAWTSYCLEAAVA